MYYCVPERQQLKQESEDKKMCCMASKIKTISFLLYFKVKSATIGK